jgi:hypothetical protein
MLGVSIPEMNKNKMSPAPGKKLICGQGPFFIKRTLLLKFLAFNRTIRKFLNTLEVHIKGIRYPPYAYFAHFFRVNVPLHLTLFITLAIPIFKTLNCIVL